MLEVANTVLIVIDVQEKLARVMHERDIMIPNLQRLIKGMIVMEVPIIVTEQYPKGLGPTVQDIALLLDNVPPIPKTSFSCLGNKEFLHQFQSWQRKQVLISGIESHVCVQQTARDLAACGYETHAVTDTITSRTPENRQTGFELMKQAGIHLTSTEAVLFELLRIAEGEKFKKISQIVK